MGFYTEYFSTLLKGIGMTALKERIEVRRAINNIRKADHTLYRSLWDHVEKEHRVTKAIQEESELIKNLKISANNCYLLVFNLSTGDVQLLKIIEGILKELEALSKSISNPKLKKIESELALTILQALKKGEKEEREEFKQVMTIIDEAEEENRNKFMANLRLAFQQEEEQTILAKFAARGEIRRARVSISALKVLPAKIRLLRIKIRQKSRNGNMQGIREMEEDLMYVKKYCSVAFQQMFYLKKRVMLLTLKILLDLNNLRLYNEKWVDKHFMPQGPIKEKIESISKIEEKISKDFHIIAQAFRIEIAKIQSLEKEAEIDASRA